MSRVFPRDSRMIAAKIVLGVALFVVLFILGMVYYFTPAYTRVGYAPIQPIAFSHEQHVGQLGIDCLYCHVHTVDSPHATVPTVDTCLHCHAADRGNIAADSPALAPLRAARETGRPVEWVRVHKMPDFVYFDHAVHVARGVSCLSCHGQVDEMVVLRHAEPMSMAWCLDCHRNPEPHLRPAELVTDMRWDPATDPILRGRGLTAEEFRRLQMQHVNAPTTCTGCHR